MVTFRFYVVSTVALFLALAVGVVVGSALDERIVDSMQDRIDRVEDNLDETGSAIDEKNATIDELERYVAASAPYTVEGRLPDTAVVLVAEEGVDAEAVERLVVRLRQAGASLPGIVWLQPEWGRSDDESVAALADALSLDADSARRVHDAAIDAVVEDLVTLAPDAADRGDPDTSTSTTGADGTTTTSSPPATSVDGSPAADPFSLPTVEALEAAGFVSFQAVDGDVAGTASSVVFVGVTGTESDLARPGSSVAAMAEVAAASDVASVVGEVFVTSDDGPDRGELLADVPEGSGVSTVDDLEQTAGSVAVVLALEGWRDGIVGRYGYGPDTDGVLPEWRAP